MNRLNLAEPVSCDVVRTDERVIYHVQDGSVPTNAASGFKRVEAQQIMYFPTLQTVEVTTADAIFIVPMHVIKEIGYVKR